MELSRNHIHPPEAFVSHPNATLTPRTRLRLARLIVEEGWTCTAAAKMFMVAAKTAAKWARRYRLEGVAGMADRSSRPHHSPTRTPEHLVRAIVRLRWRKRLGPVQIAGRLGPPASTVHAVLVRCRINRLARIDRVTGEPLRRYEHDHPGSLLHVDVTKFSNLATVHCPSAALSEAVDFDPVRQRNSSGRRWTVRRPTVPEPSPRRGAPAASPAPVCWNPAGGRRTTGRAHHRRARVRRVLPTRRSFRRLRSS